MAGLTKQELAGKTAYITSTDPAPQKLWTDLTQEERQAWIDGTATAVPEAKKSPAAGVAETTPAESTAPAGDAVATADAQEVIGIPFTDPEHGDLTPAFAEWYLATHGRDAFAEKYKCRETLLPAHLTEGGAA